MRAGFSADLRELVGTLAGLPGLQGCDPTSLRRLAKLGRRVHLPAAWTVVHEYTPGDTCYLVIDGEAEVTRRRSHVATIGSGALFGEAGALEHHLRNATVTARTPLEVLAMPCQDLLALLDQEPDLAERLLADYRKRADAAG